jgi:hypothetical protein
MPEALNAAQVQQIRSNQRPIGGRRRHRGAHVGSAGSRRISRLLDVAGRG